MADPVKTERAGVRFLEAIEFLRRRLNISSAEWREIWVEAGAISTEASEAMAESMVRELIAAVLEVMETGGTVRDFRKNYDRIVAAHGWTVPAAPDPSIETFGNPPPEGRGWHSEIVFRLHVQTAYSAGRWEQAQRMKANSPGVPLYGRYITAGDHRVRPNHALWQGIVLPIEHPFWQTHWTPNGFNCRCHVQVISDLTIRRYGWAITPDDDPRLRVPPDPGFAGNPGIAGARAEAIGRARTGAPAGTP